jgi:hypothetical protein
MAPRCLATQIVTTAVTPSRKRRVPRSAGRLDDVWIHHFKAKFLFLAAAVLSNFTFWKKDYQHNCALTWTRWPIPPLWSEGSASRPCRLTQPAKDKANYRSGESFRAGDLAHMGPARRQARRPRDAHPQAPAHREGPPEQIGRRAQAA